MLKRLSVAFAALFAFVSLAQAAGTVPGFALTPQFDLSGKIAPGCKLFVYQAGTVATPQNAYQDSGLSILHPNPLTCDAAGRLPQWFVADGSIKLRLTDKNQVQIFVGDNILVIGASSGGGGGSPVDPTAVLTTGDLKIAYGTSTLAGWVRANGRTIGSATSGASERANADCQELFQYLWGADLNLAVSGGRGASAAADWAANKTIVLPDARGRTLAGLDDMGNAAAGRLTATYFGTAATTLGAAGGGQSKALVTANLPPYTPAGTIANGAITGTLGNMLVSSGTGGASNGITVGPQVGSASLVSFGSLSISQGASTFTGTAQGGTSTAFATVQPTILVTVYLKL